MPNVSAGHYILGSEGLALLRGWLADAPELLDRRVDELARFASAPEAAGRTGNRKSA